MFLEGRRVFGDTVTSKLEVHRTKTPNLACIRGPGLDGLQLKVSGSPATSANIKINHN